MRSVEGRKLTCGHNCDHRPGGRRVTWKAGTQRRTRDIGLMRRPAGWVAAADLPRQAAMTPCPTERPASEGGPCRTFNFADSPYIRGTITILGRTLAYKSPKI